MALTGAGAFRPDGLALLSAQLAVLPLLLLSL